MNNNQQSSTGINRRAFVAGCAGCMIAMGGLAHSAAPLCTLSREEMYPKVKARVRLVFSYLPSTGPIWPNIGFDFEARKRELTSQLEKSCPDIQFIPITLETAEDTKKMLAEDKDIDGYLNFILGIWTPVSQTLAESGKRVIMADDLYGGSGQFLVEYAKSRREKRKVVGVSSSDINDVVKALHCFSTMRKMRASKVLDITNAADGTLWGGMKIGDIKDFYGTDVILVSSDELEAAYRKANRDNASAWAKQWIRKARKVMEPSPEEIEKSAVMYIALQDLLRERGAQAVTINCLGLFYGNKMSAYPCLGFFQLNNDGLVGACESDLPSTLTMLIVGYLTGQPGYISDPVIDTSKNQIIYAHCVSTNKVFGPEGRSNSYIIRNHSEDRKGAVVQSLMPLGETVTTLLFSGAQKKVILHQAKTVANINEDKACRTKLAAEVMGDINKLLGEWDQWGWHRVTVYGDHKKEIEDYAALMGMEMVYEA